VEQLGVLGPVELESEGQARSLAPAA
jgi:hypothetical protein